MSTHRQYFPDEEDATGAAKALMRLQDTYQLDSEAFARGKLPGNQDECELITLRKHEKVKSGEQHGVCFTTIVREEDEEEGGGGGMGGRRRILTIRLQPK